MQQLHTENTHVFLELCRRIFSNKTIGGDEVSISSDCYGVYYDDYVVDIGVHDEDDFICLLYFQAD